VKNNRSLAEKAKAYAFLLLKYRLRSEKELFSRMSRKKFPNQVIRETIDFLKEKKFIDDTVFARAWVASRWQKAIGPRRLRQELRLKGIDKELIAQSLEGLSESSSQREAIRDIAQSRLARMKGLDPRTARRRLYAYLVRRGFSPDEILDCLTENTTS